jgi:hypothetical protein
MDTESSDLDIRSIFVHPTSKILSLYGYNDYVEDKENGNDIVSYEVEKFMKLALAANPGMIELLYMTPTMIDATYEGKLLLDNRSIFLSNTIRARFTGYVKSQRMKMYREDNPIHWNRRYPKHIRYCHILLDEAEQLLTSGTMTIKLKPERVQELFELGTHPLEKALGIIQQRGEEIEKLESVLPDKPDYDKAEEILQEIRKINY